MTKKTKVIAKPVKKVSTKKPSVKTVYIDDEKDIMDMNFPATQVNAVTIIKKRSAMNTGEILNMDFSVQVLEEKLEKTLTKHKRKFLKLVSGNLDADGLEMKKYLEKIDAISKKALQQTLAHQEPVEEAVQEDVLLLENPLPEEPVVAETLSNLQTFFKLLEPLYPLMVVNSLVTIFLTITGFSFPMLYLTITTLATTALSATVLDKLENTIKNKG